jgi:hypothetical protein
MTEIVQSLFGVTPEMYQQSQQARIDAQALQYAQLDPFQQASFAVGRGANMLGGAIGRSLGGQDPEEVKIRMQQQLLSGVDLSDPTSLIQGARQANQMGLPQLAANLVDRSKSLQESAGRIAAQNAQLAKALQPDKLTGDERYINILQNLETMYANNKEPTATQLSLGNMAGQMLSKPRSYLDAASGQMITQPATDPSQAFPLTYKAMRGSSEGGATTVPKPTVQQATTGNLPAASQQDIAEIDANLEKIANSTQLDSLSKSLKSGEVKFNAAANAFDFLGAIVPPIFGGQEVGSQVKKDEFTRAITERVNFVLNAAKGVQAKDDAIRAKEQIASPSTFYSSARMQGALDSLVKAEESLKKELLAKKTALQSQGKTEAPNVPSAKPSTAQPSTVQQQETKPTAKPVTQMNREQKIDAVIRFNASKGVTVSPQQAEKALRDAGKL